MFAFPGDPKMMGSGTKWVAVARHGLKLWENDATPLISVSRPLLTPKTLAQKSKIFKNPKIWKMGRRHGRSPINWL